MKLILMAVITICTLSFTGCSEKERLNETSFIDYEMSFKRDTNVQELLSIRNDMIARVFEKGISGAEMSDIVKNNDTEKFATILGYTEEELSDLGKRIAFLGNEIQKKYPELTDMAVNRDTECPGCNFENIAEKWDQTLITHKEADEFYREGELQIPLPDPSQKGVSCQWVPYTATLAVCTTTGPLLYWACAVVAVCTFCTGGWVTTLCQQ